MPELKPAPTLADFQSYVRKMEEERGFTGHTIFQEALLLGEETGEVLKAVRKSQQMTVADDCRTLELGEELADVFIILCAIANRAGIDLEDAFRGKEDKNKQRKWA